MSTSRRASWVGIRRRARAWIDTLGRVVRLVSAALDTALYLHEVPNAPAPRYNDQGRPLGDWTAVVRYDSVRDRLLLTWHRDATSWSRAENDTVSWAGDETETIVQGVCDTVRRLHQPRLF